MEELLSSATIGKTHGVKGFLRVYSLSGDYSHLKKLKECYALFPDGREKLLSVSDISMQGDLFLMRFSGYDTPESARLLSGSILRVKRSDAHKLKKGEFYIADLYGLKLVYQGNEVGTVVSVSEGAQAMLLSIDKDGKEYLVPYLPVFVSSPDFSTGTIELRMGELLDL